MQKTWSRSVLSILCIFLLVSPGCVVRAPVNVKPLRPNDAVRVSTPVKAHLADGSTIVYPDGVSVSNGKLLGTGRQFDLALNETGQVTEVPLEKVVALESYENTPNKQLTVLASGGATIGVIIGAALLTVAIFGSCPTIYGDVDGERKLQAELFSYSIAPLFEAADVDRLDVAPDGNGIVELEVRNEALETHYINRLELLEIAHERSETIVPDEQGRPLAVQQLSAPSAAVDRNGRDVLPLLAQNDGRVFRTDAAIIESATTNDFRDAIELQFQNPRGRTEMALLLRMRNSLLNTVLFYDSMLKRPGARSLDWLHRDLGEIGPAFGLGSWYSSRMGMRIETWRGDAYQLAARIADTGPIAWKDVAVVVPVDPNERTVRVRLSFVADNWRIDQVRLAETMRRAEARIVAASEVVMRDGTRDEAAVRSLATADTKYLQTSPGQSFRIRFDTGPSPRARTFLLHSRGYYTEWVRASWVATATPSDAFTPDDATLVATLRQWRDVQQGFEAQFDATRLPVR